MGANWANVQAVNADIAAHPGHQPGGRPRVCGKYLFSGNRKLWVRGATYGTFRPSVDGQPFPSSDVVEDDFSAMVANGINAVRVYTMPPKWLLDNASRHGLWVMIGLPWEQHVAFLESEKQVRAIRERVRTYVRSCAGHPAILCYAIGNEIPAPIVRWHGRHRIEHFLQNLFEVAKGEDPEALMTYVNYPTTEYLDLSFLDLLSFNVYLESKKSLSAYLSRLHNIAGDQPLLMAEIGLDSRSHGQEKQAELVDWQTRTAFASACCGAFIFSWTDEWYRGGYDIENWDFGLTTRNRRPKLVLDAVRQAFAEVPFSPNVQWPKISVVVCSFNGARTIRDTLDALQALNYPDFEVIIVDDGSTDSTAEIARQYPVQLIRTENRGLSCARNTGMEASKSEIIAYTDDDAYPDPDWLTFLAARFLTTKYAGVGGPNIAPAGDGWIADCVANAPGGPAHVLITDELADHIPGCNMAFRKECLRAIGGFDPRFRSAGDDVDICWRLQAAGWALGFSAGAVVWHHRRNSIRLYWRQQKGYGRAEALLESKWPSRYNSVGHLRWPGRIYGNGIIRSLSFNRAQIYQGTWGSALFQSIYHSPESTLLSVTMMPEWYLAIAALSILTGLGLIWSSLLVLCPLLVVTMLITLAYAYSGAARAKFQDHEDQRFSQTKRRVLTFFLYLLQPLARLFGRLKFGLTVWRRRGDSALKLPSIREVKIWDENWKPLQSRLSLLETALEAKGSVTLRGGDYDTWDLEVRGGLLGSVRTLMAVEEHGGGKQLVRIRTWPRARTWTIGSIGGFAVLSFAASLQQEWFAAVMLGGGCLALALRAVTDCAFACGLWVRALDVLEGKRL